MCYMHSLAHFRSPMWRWSRNSRHYIGPFESYGIGRLPAMPFRELFFLQLPAGRAHSLDVRQRLRRVGKLTLRER